MYLSERAVYEQKRRKIIAEQRKKFQVLFPWLEITNPEVFLQFGVFFKELSAKNPRSKNLSVTKNFKRFLREGKGMFVMCWVVIIVVIVIICAFVFRFCV